MAPEQILAYALVAGLSIAAPGADFANVLRHAMAGRRNGLLAAAGVGAGLAVHATAASVGLGALLLASATAFTVVKLLGAAYLVWLGAQALRAAVGRRGGHGPADAVAAGSGTTGVATFRQAALVNALNPKAVLTFLAIMPQFLPADAVLADTLVLSAVTIALAVAWFALVATAVASLRALFARERVRRALDAVTGGVLVLLGVRLAAASR